MSSESSKSPARVLLWTTGRSLSNAILKSFTYGVPNPVVWHEPYNHLRRFSDKVKDPIFHAFSQELIEKHGGADALAKIESGYDASDKDYDWLKAQLEAEYPGKSLIIAKNSGTSIMVSGQQSKLPKGYRHMFLIRHPHKVMMSKVKAFAKMEANSGVKFNKLSANDIRHYEHLNKVWKYVKSEGLDERPVIIDADDLVANPKAILEAFCNEVGIPFTEDLLTWPARDDVMTKLWMTSKQNILIFRTMGFSEATWASTGFYSKTSGGGDQSGSGQQQQQEELLKKMPPAAQVWLDKVKEITERELPFYEELYKERLTVNNNA